MIDKNNPKYKREYKEIDPCDDCFEYQTKGIIACFEGCKRIEYK